MKHGAPTCSETDIRATRRYSATPGESANSRMRRFSAATGATAAGLGSAWFPLLSSIVLIRDLRIMAWLDPSSLVVEAPSSTEERRNRGSELNSVGGCEAIVYH